MFEFLVEKEQNPRRLNDPQKTEIVGKISGLWSDWDAARSKQKTIAEKLYPELYLDEREKKDLDDNEAWKSDVHLNKMYSLFQTQQAFIWDNIYSHIDNLFDVEGTDAKSAETAALQKQNLVNTFYKIGIQRKLDAAIEYLGSVGESCLFVSWKTLYKQVRRRLADMPNVLALFSTANFGVFNQEIYNGANVEAIDPLNLVFDPRVTPEDTQSWDSCGKIIKSWETYSTIANNKLYNLSKADLEELKAMLSSAPTDRDKTAAEKTDEVIDNNRAEVLQYWGDYTMADGTVLKNWHIVVIARQYLAVFEHNRWVINPIICCSTMRDAKSKRGIPELWSIYDLCKEQENKVNLQNDAQSLNLNPPAYAPEGFFKEEKVRLYPGKQVEYKQGLEDPSAIIKMQFPLLSNEQIIEYYDSTASNVSGIFPNMQGQDEAKDATATEIKVKVQGQTTRLSKILDTLKQNMIVPMVAKVADLQANMLFDDEQIFVNEDGVQKPEVITNEVRQGRYEYRYTDNSGIQKKLAENQTLTNILAPVWNDPAVPLNKQDVIKEALNNAGIENADKFFAPVQAIPQAQMPGNQMPEAAPEVNPEAAANGQVNSVA